MTIRLRLATEADDAQLLRLHDEATMADDGGFVSLDYGRRPSFLRSLDVEGQVVQVPVFYDDANGRIVGTCTRALRPGWINGGEAVVGYIGGARIIPLHRKGTIVVRAYKALRELHEEDRAVECYVSTILRGNDEARRVLTSGRAGLPAYREMGRYVCHGILASSRFVSSAEPARCDDVPGMVACLHRWGRRRQFAPRWREEDLDPGTSLTQGVTLDDWLVVRRQQKIVATGAVWDQSAFKQTTIARWSPLLKVFRAVWNVFMPRRGYGALPAAGQALPLAFGAFIAADDDEPDLVRQIIAGLARSWAKRGGVGLVVGLHEDDPLATALAGFWSVRYESLLYVVHWPDGQHGYDSLDGRLPFVEAATL